MLLIDFIDARLPGFRDAVRGASPERIAALEARTRAPLPRYYLDFLTTMGESSSKFPAFPGYVWTAAALLDCWPGDDAVAYDKDRYFKVALNPGVRGASYDDLFLDLARGDDDDAPLVRFEDPSEDGVPGDPRLLGDASEVNLGIRAWLCERAFHSFELMRRPELAHVGVGADEREPEKSWRGACEVFDQLGLEQPLQAPNARFGVGPEVSVYGMLVGRGMFIRVGADSRSGLLRVVETLRDNLEVFQVSEVPRQESPTSL